VSGRYYGVKYRYFTIEVTGAWLETEEDRIESRADLRNRLGSVLEEGDLFEDRRDEVLNALYGEALFRG
jgi:hypothetical protein